MRLLQFNRENMYLYHNMHLAYTLQLVMGTDMQHTHTCMYVCMYNIYMCVIYLYFIIYMNICKPLFCTMTNIICLCCLVNNNLLDIEQCCSSDVCAIRDEYLRDIHNTCIDISESYIIYYTEYVI